MQVDPESGRDLLFVAGGTGLAPCRAMVEHLARWNSGREAHLFLGARRTDELYAFAALCRFADGLPWLTVVGAVSDDPGYLGRRGPVGDVAASFRSWTEHDVYVSGPPAMVQATVEALRRHGVPLERVQYDPLTG